MADGTWSERETQDNAVGLKTQASEWTTLGGPRNWTYFADYDAFGRPETIVPPDGAAHLVLLTYTGDRVVLRKTKIGTSRVGGTTVGETSETRERYDRQGRLIAVIEPSGSGGANVTTNYSYDVGNRLAHVTTSANSVTQTREFVYDNLGRLKTETHPEISGQVTHQDYDARGHAGRHWDGLHDLKYEYDSAERLTKIREIGTNGRDLKIFTYAAANGTDDWRNGKLWIVSRFNYFNEPGLPDQIFADGFESGDLTAWSSSGTEAQTPNVKLALDMGVLALTPGDTATAEIRETYTYGGRGGRISRRDLVNNFTFNDIGPSIAESFTQTWTHTDLGDVATLGYPQCTFAACSAAATPKTVTHSYSRGFLTGVDGYTSSITYHPNGLLSQLAHSNGVTVTQAKDPSDMIRPLSITATKGANTLWSTGSYEYDGSGNVTEIGTSWFLYDKVSRLTSGAVFTGPTGGGNQKQQTYTYDAFGNIQSIGGDSARATPTDSATNRLQGAATYDGAGNLTSWNGNTYEYDAFNQMIRMKSGDQDWLYSYTADDERVWQFDANASSRFDRWTLRDLSGKVLRAYEATGYGGWHVESDYVYRDGSLLASETPSGRKHFHLDHLGTPRLITDTGGDQAAYHVYYPFGEEATDPFQDEEALKFTGHERDLNDPSGAGDDLDYMHARHCSPMTARFMSTDPIYSAIEKAPQSWNRYSYARNSPMSLLDPTGLYETNCGDDLTCQARANAFEKARLANLEREEGVRETALAYGKPGEANGVTVVFKETDLGSAANVAADIDFHQENGGFVFTAIVTIHPDLDGTELEAIVGHEGQHVLDARAFFASFTEKGWYDLSLNLTHEQAEQRAYQITHAILETSNTPLTFRGKGGGVQLGTFSQQKKIDRAIRRILDGPLYARILNDRMFPRHDTQQ